MSHESSIAQKSLTSQATEDFYLFLPIKLGGASMTLSGHLIVTNRRNPLMFCQNIKGDCPILQDVTIFCHEYADLRRGEVINGFVCIKLSVGHTETFKPADNTAQWTEERRRQWQTRQLQEHQLRGAITIGVSGGHFLSSSKTLKTTIQTLQDGRLWYVENGLKLIAQRSSQSHSPPKSSLKKSRRLFDSAYLQFEQSEGWQRTFQSISSKPSTRKAWFYKQLGTFIENSRKSEPNTLFVCKRVCQIGGEVAA